jgi:hypothetical protein
METHQRNGSLREAERDADGDRYEKGRSDGDRSGGEDRSDGVRSGGRERERGPPKEWEPEIGPTEIGMRKAGPTEIGPAGKTGPTEFGPAREREREGALQTARRGERARPRGSAPHGSERWRPTKIMGDCALWSPTGVIRRSTSARHRPELRLSDIQVRIPERTSRVR